MNKIEKPWGSEEILFTDEKYTVKRLFMKKDHCCSLQYHKEKQETIYVVEGVLRIYQTDRIYPECTDLFQLLYSPGEYVTFYPGEIHRMEGFTDVIYLECSTSEINDVVRIDDKYGRT